MESGPYLPRRVSRQAREIDWSCGHCGCRDANQFSRDGHYLRALDTGWGQIKGLKVPMVECGCCGHDVVCHFTILEKYQRFWLDLDQDVLFGSGLCQSLRQLSQRWSALVGGSVGLRTINERINQIEPLLKQAHQDPISDVAPVVHYDGIWLRLQISTDTYKRDKRQRQRQGRKGKKVVLLVALGLWPDGRRVILDWELADSESQAAWERLVHRVWERGVRLEKGLQAVGSRWQWRVRGSIGLGLWSHSPGAALYLSQVTQCRRPMPQGTQGGCPERDADSVAGAGQGHLSS